MPKLAEIYHEAQCAASWCRATLRRPTRQALAEAVRLARWEACGNGTFYCEAHGAKGRAKR